MATQQPAPVAEKPAGPQAHGQHPQWQQWQPPKPEPFKPSKPFSVGKVALATANFVFAVITLGLSLALVTQYTLLDSWLSAIIAAAAGGATMVWQIAEYITMTVRGSIYRPIHPGAHIAVHICLDVLSILVASSLGISLAYTLSDWNVDPGCESGSYAYYDDDGDYVYCGFSSFASEDAAHRYFRMAEALVAFTTFMAICHFVLAVLACVETHRRRKYGKQQKVVYLVPAAGAPVPMPAGAGAGADQGTYGYYAPTHSAAPGRAEQV